MFPRILFLKLIIPLGPEVITKTGVFAHANIYAKSVK